MDGLSLKSSKSFKRLTRKLTFKRSKSDTDLYLPSSSKYIKKATLTTSSSCPPSFDNLSSFVSSNHHLNTIRSREIEALITCHPTCTLYLSLTPPICS
ncbi:unnamed protein product [Cunninghamella blakesleeana]